MTQYIPAFVVIWLGLAAAFYIEHSHLKHLHFLIRYIIGLGTFCAGLALFGLLIDAPLLVFVPGFLATSGLVVIACYRGEAILEKRDQAARRGGEIVGMARGLQQELRGHDAGRESDMDGPGRKN